MYNCVDISSCEQRTLFCSLEKEPKAPFSTHSSLPAVFRASEMGMVPAQPRAALWGPAHGKQLDVVQYCVLHIEITGSNILFASTLL